MDTYLEVKLPVNNFLEVKALLLELYKDVRYDSA